MLPLYSSPLQLQEQSGGEVVAAQTQFTAASPCAAPHRLEGTLAPQLGSVELGELVEAQMQVPAAWPQGRYSQRPSLLMHCQNHLTHVEP